MDCLTNQVEINQLMVVDKIHWLTVNYKVKNGTNLSLLHLSQEVIPLGLLQSHIAQTHA